jgi:anti-sigma-K factor RskA
MTCKEIRELLPDLALGLSPASGETAEHLQKCSECATKLTGIRSTMALMDEWQAPEPSPYFDVRLQARLREEKEKAQTAKGWLSQGWLGWMRKPVLTLAATAAVAIGIMMFRGDQAKTPTVDATAVAAPGTAVGDLQSLDKNTDLYSDADVLDDLDVQQDGTANP